MAYQQDLAMYLYEDVNFNFTANSDVTNANLTGANLVFTVRDQFNGNILIQRTGGNGVTGNGITVSNATVGNFTVSIASANTDGVPPAPCYVYDVQRTDAGNDTVLAIGKFSLKPEVRLT